MYVKEDVDASLKFTSEHVMKNEILVLLSLYIYIYDGSPNILFQQYLQIYKNPHLQLAFYRRGYT